MKLRLPAALIRMILLCMAGAGVTYGTGTGAAVPEEGVCSVVWKPAPAEDDVKDEETELSEEVAEEADDVAIDAAETTAALAEEEGVLDEQDLTVPADLTDFAGISLQNVTLLGYASASGNMGGGMRLVLERDGDGYVKWRFALDNGKEGELDPDDTTWAFWDNPEGYNPAYFAQHYLHDGYSAVWVSSTHKIFVPVFTAAPGTGGGAASTPSYSGGGTRTAVVSSGNAGGGGAGGAVAPAASSSGNSPAAQSAVSLGLELGYGSAASVYVLSNGQLQFTGANQLLINLLGWDGTSTGTFALLTPGAGSTLQLNGSALVDGVDYLSQLDSVSVLYTKADGSTASLDLADSANGNLSYALQLVDGTLSLVVSQKQQAVPRMAGFFSSVATYAVASPVATASVASVSEDSGMMLFGATTYTWNAGNGTTLDWGTSSEWGTQGNYVNSSPVEFSSDNVDGAATTTVTLTSSVTTGTVSITGEDNFTLALGGNTLSASSLVKTGSGTLTLSNGTLQTGLLSLSTSTVVFDGNMILAANEGQLELSLSNGAGVTVAENGSLNLSVTDSTLSLQLGETSFSSTNTDYTLVRGNVTINGNTLTDLTDYLAAANIRSVIAGGTSLLDNTAYNVYLVKVGDELRLRVLDANHGAGTYTWSNADGAELKWSSIGWHEQAYYAGSTVSFVSDEQAGTADTTVSILSDVSAKKITVSGEDNFTLDLGQNRLTVTGVAISQTGDGTLTFQNGTLEVCKKENVFQNVVLKNVTIEDDKVETNSVTFKILDHGTFTMDGGSGTIYKINASNDHTSTETKVILQNKAQLTIDRDNGTSTSGLETAYLEILSGATLKFTGRDSLKAEHILISGAGSTLTLKNPLLKPEGTGFTKTDLTLKNGATLCNGKDNGTTVLNLTSTSSLPSLNITLDGTTSYLTGKWEISKIQAITLKDLRAYITVSDSLKLSATGYTVNLGAVFNDERTDYTLFKGNVTLGSTTLSELKDYYATSKILSVTAGDTTLTGNADYKVYLVKVGDELRLRVVDSNHGPGDFTWSHTDGAELKWSSIGWHDQAYYAGSTVSFVSDNEAGVAGTTVSILSDVTAGAMTVSGEDSFSFSLGGHTLTANSLSASGGTVTFTNGGSLTLIGETPTVALSNGAKLVNDNSGSFVLGGSATTLTSSGTTAPSLVGLWTLGTQLTLNVGAEGWRALGIGGDDNRESRLTIDNNAFIIDLGGLWNGTDTLANPISLFTVGSNGTLKIGSTELSGDVSDCLSLLTKLTVNYNGGSADLKQSSYNYLPSLYYQDGTLYLNINKRGECVWKHTDGESMTWTYETWDVDGEHEMAYTEYDHVRFTGTDDTSIDNVTVTINAIWDAANTSDKTVNVLRAGNFTVEGEDNFTFNISGRMLMTGFTKTGTGTATLNAVTNTYRPVFKVLDGDFVVSEGTLNAETCQLEVENGNLIVDGTEHEARLIAAFKLASDSSISTLYLKNSTFEVKGGLAFVDVRNMVGENGSVLDISQGATVSSRNDINMPVVRVRGTDSTLTVNSTVKAGSITVSDGGTLILNKQFVRYSDSDTTLMLENGGTLRNTGNASICLNDFSAKNGQGQTLRSKLVMTVSGSASVLEGDWTLDASLATTLKFADSNPSAISIQNGTLDIVNTHVDGSTTGITLDLTGVWDGYTAINQRLFRTVAGGSLLLNGAAMADGDITSNFLNFWVRYGTGASDIINISDAGQTASTGWHYQLRWLDGSLYFVVDGLNENGPYVWRHSYQQEYAPLVPEGQTRPDYLLTWQDEHEWRPASSTYSTSATLNIPAATYHNGKIVSFVGDADDTVDDVTVTIVGTVAPGESSSGIAGITVTGADNFLFTGNAVIADWKNDKGGIISATSLSKSGTGTLTIGADVTLDYSGRTEVLAGKVLLEGTSWDPKGIITVAADATLQLGADANLGHDLQSYILTVGNTMLVNNGDIVTNIVRTSGTQVTGDGDWLASYLLVEHSKFHAGTIQLRQPETGNASLVVNDSDITLSGYLSGAGQNLTIMNRGYVVVEGSQGANADHAAAELASVIITGEGTGLSFTGGGTLRAETVDISHGATLSLSQSLEHVTGKKLTMTLAYGATLHNNTSQAIVLNNNDNAAFVQVIRAGDEPNYYEGNWTLDFSKPFELDFTYFDSSTTAVPQVIRNGTFALVNADQSLNENGISQFTFRADGIRYDTIEFISLGDRGKISINGSVLSNNVDYLDSLKSIGYWFHNGAKNDDGETVWTYVDLVNKTTLENWSIDANTGLLTGTVKQLTDTEFADLTGLKNGVNFKMLFENNTLSLVIAPDGPVYEREYYYWTGFTTNGTTGVTSPYNTWTRHNSTDLSPWMGDDIFQNGYRTIFSNADEKGAMVQSYTIEIENSVATGSKVLKDGTKAGIYFTNRGANGYILQSEAYNSSGCIADISEDNLTTLTVQGGYVEIKTSNTYGGKLSQDETVSNCTTQVLRAMVTAEESGTSGLIGKDKTAARQADLVSYTQYTYAYVDINEDGTLGTELHFVSKEVFEAAPEALHRKYEQVYATQSADGSWLVRGEVIPVHTVYDLVLAYKEKDADQYYAYVYTTGTGENRVVHFLNAEDFKDKVWPDGVTPTKVNISQVDGTWKVDDATSALNGTTLGLSYIETVVETNRVFGYAYYDNTGKLHFTTKSQYDEDNRNTATDPTDRSKTIQIRLVYSETDGWYTPGVLLTSNEHALGTSEVLIGTGARLLANTNLNLTSLTLEKGASVEARGDLHINKELTVTSLSRVEVNGKLAVGKITVENGATFVTHDVEATNITLESGATWDLNSKPQSLLDVSERIVITGGSTMKGAGMMRDGMLELVSGGTDNHYVTIDGTLKLGTNATLDLTRLLAEETSDHYRSPLFVSKKGLLVLEPHNAIMLSMAQVEHLLQDHDENISHENHYMHIATLDAGADFALTQVGVDAEGNQTVTDQILGVDQTQSIHLAEGLGYMLDAVLKRQSIASDDESEAGMHEILLHLSVRSDCPAYVWDGDYNGHDAEGNDNIWSMGNGGDGRYAWSGNAVYGAVLGDSVADHLNWGKNVYFLETGYSVDENGKASKFHYVNDHVDSETEDLDDRAKYVDIRGAVWSETITVDVDRLYDMTADQYLRNVGYLFYSLDGSGTITDCAYWRDADGTYYALGEYTAEQAAAYGWKRVTTGIVKEGTGMLTLATENSFSGDVMLNSGSIFVTNQRALGTSHVYMQDGTNLYINYTFEASGDSAYRNPVLDNDITISGGDVTMQTERNLGGDRLVSVTIGYSPISAVDALNSITGKTSVESEESTSRHWRTLSITGALHGDAKTEIHLQGYTSYVVGSVYTSMFHIYGSEGETDFAGTIKLENYRNISPAAYNDANKSDPTKLDDTNSSRGTGAVQLSISDATLQYATLDLTRQNVLAAYERKSIDRNGKVTTSTGFGRRQTPTNILLLEGSAAVAGLNADFLGTVVRTQRDENGNPSPKLVEILAATQAYELASVRVISLGNYTLTLHSDKDYDYVFSGVVGGEYAYASQGKGTIPEAGEDADPKFVSIAKGKISLVHTGDGTQYIHSGYLQDLTIGNEVSGTYTTASGGAVGFHYLDLQGNLTLHSGSALILNVDDCRRTANADGSTQELHWDESSFSSSNVTLQSGKHVNVVTSVSKLATVTDVNISGEKVEHERAIPVGSEIRGDLTVSGGAYLDFYSRGIEPIVVADFGASSDMAKKMTDSNYHPEVGVNVNAPTDGYMLDITGRLVLKGDVRVDFAGVTFDSATNGVTYYLARAQKGIIGTVTQQTISLGNGYYGIIRGLQTYNRLVESLQLPVFGEGVKDFTSSSTEYNLNDLSDVRVALVYNKETQTYSFDYKTYTTAENAKTRSLDLVETANTLTLTQVSGNVYQYEVGGNTYQTVLLDMTGDGTDMAARLNLIDLAYDESPGYIIMTVTNTPPRVWFNQDNVQVPVSEICAKTDAGNNVMVTPNGTKFILGSQGAGGAIGFGNWTVGTLWTSSSPDAGGWIDTHDAFMVGCRVQFNKYGTARYHGVEGENAIYTRGAYTVVDEDTVYIALTHNTDRDEYGWYETSGESTVWRGAVATMYGKQFDIVELEGDVQARSIYVDCETGIHDDDGNLLVNSDNGYVNYWFRSAETDDAGRIGDIEVTSLNYDILTANVYSVTIGEILAVSLEKTGGGYLRISTQNTYSGGTLLRNGAIIIDNANALGKAASDLAISKGGGDGALHAFNGAFLYLNYVGSDDTADFDNDIKLYSADTSVRVSGDAARAAREGFTVSNGINLTGSSTAVHFVNINGAVTAIDDDSVLTLSGLLDPNNGTRDYTVFTLANLADYDGKVRLDSHFLNTATNKIADSGGDVALRITGSAIGKAVIDLGLNSAFHNALILDMQKASSGSTFTLSGLSGLVGGELTKDANGNWVGYNSCVVSAKRESGQKATLQLDVSYGNALYAGTVGYGYYHATEGTDIGVIHASSPLSLTKAGSSTQSIYSARLNGLTINQGAIQFVKDLTLSGKLSIAKESQLIIGTISEDNLTTTGNVPFSIVVQGQGILALGSSADAQTVTYTTPLGNGSEYTLATQWDKFTTDVKAYSDDSNTNALLCGGTLTSIADVSTSLTAQFADTFTIDTSHYEYEAAVLEEAGITKTAAAPTHTITLTGKLIGSGLVTVTGSGKLVLGGAADNVFFGTALTLFRVQDGEMGGTTLSLNKDHALAVLDNSATGSYTGAATLEVCDNSRAVVEQGIKAEIAAARLVNHGVVQVASSEADSPLATVGLLSASAPLAGLDDMVFAGTGDSVSGDPETLNIVNVRIASDDGKAVFTGMTDTVSHNSIKNNALVDVAARVEAKMSNLTLGSPVSKARSAEQDNTLVLLEQEATLKLDNVVIETFSSVQSAEGSYTGVVAASSAQELVDLTNTTVVTQEDVNLTLNADLVFTGDEAGSYACGNTDYTYSASSWKQNAGQVIYTLNNLHDCVITGEAGQLILQMSVIDYDALFAQINSTTLLGVYLERVGVAENAVSEQLITIQAVDASGTAVKSNGSLFYVTANASANGTVVDTAGTVFYFIPEPSTTTLSLLALAALAARRRRR